MFGCMFEKHAKLVIAIFFVTALLYFLPQVSLADPSWMPILKINNEYPEAYRLQGIISGIAIPQAEFRGTFHPGQQIDFAIDPSALVLNHIAFSINTGDGHVYKTNHVVHVYDKPGSYIVKVRAKEQIGQEDAQGNADSVLLNVMPAQDYRIPQPTISIEGKVAKGNAGNLYEVGVGTAVHFDARGSLAGTAHIVKYQWDFGDQHIGSDIAVTHTYTDPRYLFVILRTTDENGLFADTYIMLNVVTDTNQQLGSKISGSANTPETPVAPVVKKSEIKRNSVNYEANTSQQPDKISGKDNAHNPLAALLVIKAALRRRFYLFYAGVNVWLRQTIIQVGGSGPISARAIFLVLIVATFLGALHSLTPGHSKSIMAAMLIGKTGSQIKDVFVLASTITFTHTILIYVLGFFLLVLDKTISLSRIIPYFTKLNIVLVIVLGAWLITRGVRAALQRHRCRVHEHAHEHEHEHAHTHEHDHHHAHGHSHDYRQLAKTDSLWSTILAGASGGLVPCIDALSILILAVSLHMLLFGLLVILFFSLGLAISIVVLGLLVIRTKELIKIEARIGESISIYAPLLTGLVIMMFGLRLLLLVR